MMDFLTFRIGEHLLAVAAAEVEEVARQPCVTAVPRAPAGVTGLVNLRGRLATAVHLAALPPRESADTYIFFRKGETFFGLCVDRAEGVVTLSGDVVPLPAGVSAAWRRQFSGLLHGPGGVFHVFDVEKFLQSFTARSLPA